MRAAMRLDKTLLVVLMTGVVVAPAMAQAPVTGVADPESLFASPDPRLHANKQVVSGLEPVLKFFP